MRLLTLFLLITILFLLGCQEKTSIGKHEMNFDEAINYVQTWAKHRHESLSEIKYTDDRGFRGPVGAAEFEFLPSEKELIVRANVFESGSMFVNRPALLQEMQTMAKENPGLIGEASFELDYYYVTIGYKEPGLNLRINLTNGSMSNDDFLKVVEELTSNALLWNKQKLREAIIRVNEREGKF